MQRQPMTPLAPSTSQTPTYYSPPAQRMSIQDAFQVANPLLHGAQPTPVKLKERGALPYKVGWNGKLGTFEVYRRTIEAWAVQNGMRYMFKDEFLE